MIINRLYSKFFIELNPSISYFPEELGHVGIMVTSPMEDIVSFFEMINYEYIKNDPIVFDELAINEINNKITFQIILCTYLFKKEDGRKFHGYQFSYGMNQEIILSEEFKSMFEQLFLAKVGRPHNPLQT
jgi:hypothetical protein